MKFDKDNIYPVLTPEVFRGGGEQLKTAGYVFWWNPAIGNWQHNKGFKVS